MPNIDYTRSEVKKNLTKWGMIRDCLGGEEVVKSKRTTYLPQPNASDTSPENKERYQAYLRRATFLNAVDNTLAGLLGQVFNTDPVEELTPDLDAVKADITGTGVTLTQLAKNTVSEVLSVGRAGLVTDYPRAPVDAEGNARPFSRQEIADGTARPTITLYNAEQVINWRTELRGGNQVFTLVVIKTEYATDLDGFEIEHAPEWRVMLLVNGVYVLQTWRLTEKNDSSGTRDFVLFEEVVPRGHDGMPLGFIPFTFVGSVTNSPTVDKPPLYDMAVVNLAHYRNSADYEETLYMTGQFTPVATGLTERWVKDVWKDKALQLGSTAVIPLPVDGDFKLVAAEAGSALKEALDKKEQQMAMLGAQLVEQRQVQRTLGEAQMDRVQIESVLVQCAKNGGSALQLSLQWASLFFGPMAEALVYELSTDFATQRLTPDDRRQLLSEYQGGLLAFEEARNNLRQSGIAYLEDDVAKSAIDLEADQAMARAVAEATALSGNDQGGGDGGDED